MSVFLAYHYPCLDGVYSVCSPFLFFRDIQRRGFTAQDFIEYIHQFDSVADINKSFYEWKGVNIPAQEEEVKASDYDDFSHEYSPKILNNVVYLPAKLNASGSLDFPSHEYSQEHLAKSVIIFMDYSGSNAENIHGYCQMFSKVIILDHHLTFEHILEDLPAAGGIPKNLMYVYDKSMSGATVSFEFFEKVKGGPILSNIEKYNRFKEILSYVEDNDIKAGKIQDSGKFVSGIRKRRSNFDANENYDIFLELIEAKPDILIEIGTAEEKNRIEKSGDIVKQRRIIYLGGKTKDKTGRFGRCYGVALDDLELRSEVGRQLAEWSIEDGMENMGFVYSFQANDKVKVSVRSIKGLPGGDCESLGREYNGGGHLNASGFFLSASEFKKWI